MKPGKDNVKGKRELPAKGTPAWEKLFKRNEALADPRNDPRFSKISTMHPSNAAVFADTIQGQRAQEKSRNKKPKK